MINIFKKKLQEEGVKILEESRVDGFPEMVLDKIPGKKLSPSNMRKYRFDFVPFYIKSCDGRKVKQNLSYIEELRQEVKLCLIAQKEGIPFADKIAIIKSDKSSALLVEKKLTTLNRQEWRGSGKYEECVKLIKKVEEKFYDPELKPEHVGIDPETGKLKLFDVFLRKNAKDDSAHK